MASARGLVLAFGAFAAAFALHIAGGASGQRWLFAIAVALIYATATAFPTLALVLAGRATSRERDLILYGGGAIGSGLTAAALWAANGRALAWWTFPGALGLVVVVNLLLRLAFGRRLERPRALA